MSSEILDQNRNPLKNDNSSDHNMSPEMKWKESNSNNLDSKFSSSSNSEESEESIQKLNHWIWQCHSWINFHSIYQHARHSQQQQNFNSILFNTNSSSFSNRSNNRTQENSVWSSGSRREQSTIWKLASIRKRLIASLIDYFFLHFIYDQIRFLLNEMWDTGYFTSIDLKELETFFPEEEDGLEEMMAKLFWTYIKTMKYATLFYLFYLIYETLFIWGWPNTLYPGATIGKRMLGLRVISIDNDASIETVTFNENKLVRIYRTPESTNTGPGTNGQMSIFKAGLRTLLKLLPISNTIQSVNILSSRFNQSYFDSKIGCLVVDISVEAIQTITLANQNLQNRNVREQNNNNNNNNFQQQQQFW